jgi:hypothetical protein
MNHRVFSGSDDSIAFLTQIMKDGRALGDQPIDQKDSEARIRRLVFAILTPQTWRVQSKFPVLVDTGNPCNTAPGANALANREEINKANVCFLDKQYFLLTTEGKFEKSCTKVCGSPYCHTSGMKAPPGIDAIRTGSEGWGRVTVDDVVARSVQLNFSR